MTDMLKAALWYQKNGYSVIPAGRDKKPFIKWQQYQEKPADESQVREWWQRWPNANVGIVTGKVSNLTVIDADSEDGREALDGYLPDALSIPTVKTPRGYHYYFRYANGVTNGVQVLRDCDVRSEGGYVIAPPSKNGSSIPYTWVDGLKLHKTPPAVLPSELSIVFEQVSSSYIEPKNAIIHSLDPYYIDTTGKSNNKQQGSNNSNILEKGRRDNDLFRLANCLIKGGMGKAEVNNYLNYIAKTCKPPFPEKDVKLKVQSAIKRAGERDRVSTSEVREWVSATSGNFSVTNYYQSATIATPKGKAQVRAIFSRLAARGIIEKVGSMDGMYRLVRNDAQRIDLFNAKAEYLDVKFPLDLHEYYRPMQKNIIIIAGTQDVGKTAFMLNIAKLNMNRGLDVRYQTSEMGAAELRSRIDLFQPEVPIYDWKNVEFIENSTNFTDYIIPDGINIIDFMEITDAFYLVGGMLTDIFNKLEKGIAIIALQKDSKSQYGRGGSFSVEKPRLYVTLTANPPEGNIAKIEKCKNWANPDVNPNGRECVFKVIQGSKIKQMCHWGHASKEV